MTKRFLSSIPVPVLKKAREYIDSMLNDIEQESMTSSGSKDDVNATQSASNSKSKLKQQITQESVDLEEIINWAKSNVPDESGISLTVMKRRSSNRSYQYVLYLVYTKDNSPLLGEKYNSLAIFCNRLGDDLFNAFGNQDIIVIE